MLEIDGCLENQFTCSNKKCIQASGKCNGVNDCGDFSDEILPCTGRKISKVYNYYKSKDFLYLGP